MRYRNVLYRKVTGCIAGLFCLLILLLYTTGCDAPLTDTTSRYLTFTVVNVGQGNAAIASESDSALLFDMGPPEGFDSLMYRYTRSGAPPVNAIIVSHRDRDHAGGLALLPDSVRWSGLLVGSPDDSAELCALCPRAVRWRSFTQGDSLYCGGITVACLWPPRGVPQDQESVNNRSVVVRMAFGTTSVLLTGDIDTAVTRRLRELYGEELASDLLIVPHHGSKYSADRLFYGFVNPSTAIISVGEGNEYGHPHPETLEMLTRCSIPFRTTATAGSMRWNSNAFYWTETGFN